MRITNEEIRDGLSDCERMLAETLNPLIRTLVEMTRDVLLDLRDARVREHNRRAVELASRGIEVVESPECPYGLPVSDCDHCRATVDAMRRPSRAARCSSCMRPIDVLCDAIDGLCDTCSAAREKHEREMKTHAIEGTARLDLRFVPARVRTLAEIANDGDEQDAFCAPEVPTFSEQDLADLHAVPTDVPWDGETCVHDFPSNVCPYCNRNDRAETCPHGNPVGDCGRCDSDGDFAFDASREDRVR